MQATQCRIVWGKKERNVEFSFMLNSILDPPRDNGGADIQQYHLELEESKGNKNENI
jgi:hypothetical protein